MLPKGASRLPVITDRIILVSNRQANRLAYSSRNRLRIGESLGLRWEDLDFENKVIQSVMGHRNIETTMDIYAEAIEEKKQETFVTNTNKVI